MQKASKEAAVSRRSRALRCLLLTPLAGLLSLPLAVQDSISTYLASAVTGLSLLLLVYLGSLHWWLPILIVLIPLAFAPR